MKKNFDLVYYRAAGAPISTATKGGTYPAYTFSGWTPVVGVVAKENTNIGIDKDGVTELGDGTEYVGGEAAPVSVELVGFTGANYATLRGAMINTKLDFMLMDSEQPAVAYAAFGIRAYPKLDLASGEEPKIVVSGSRKAGAGVTNTPFAHVTVS
jgi:hypothetical protein